MDVAACPERATSPKKRKHEEATTSEKYELYLHASKNPQLKQRELAEWFESTFHKAINQSTVSRNLKKFKSTPAPLEVRFEAGCPPLPPHPPHALPPTPPPSNPEDFSHPELDNALHNWFMGCDDRKSIDNEALKAKAEELNSKIYSDEIRKPCTDSWLDAWRRRHDALDLKRTAGPEREGSKETEGDVSEMKVEGSGESSLSPKPKNEDTDEKRRRREIKRLRKDIEKRDIQMAKAKIRKEASIRRLEELEKELGQPKL